MFASLKSKFQRSRLQMQRVLGSRADRRWAMLQARYGTLPRFVETKIQLGGLHLVVPDVASALSAYNAIFLRGIYHFKTSRNAPVIVDAGANIGISVLYFKWLYPNAQITAFEPDPHIFSYLEKNLAANQAQDVVLENKALWSQEETLHFGADGADGGRVQNSGSIDVPAVPLAPYLTDHTIDFLKMDVEGSEAEVLAPCYKKLSAVQRAFVEYHSFPEKPQRLAEIVSGMQGAGFRTYVHNDYVPPRPFTQRIANDGMDMRLNLFFTRDE